MMVTAQGSNAFLKWTCFKMEQSHKTMIRSQCQNIIVQYVKYENMSVMVYRLSLMFSTTDSSYF